MRSSRLDRRRCGGHVEHGQPRAFPGQDANIGMCGQFAHHWRIWARSVLAGMGPVGNPWMLARCVTLRVATGTMPLSDVVQWDDVPVPSGIIEGCRQKLPDGWGVVTAAPPAPLGARPGEPAVPAANARPRADGGAECLG